MVCFPLYIASSKTLCAAAMNLGSVVYVVETLHCNMFVIGCRCCSLADMPKHWITYARSM